MEEEEMKLDKEELIKQSYDEIIKKGKYAEARIVIEAGKGECIPTLALCNVGIKEVAFLISSLEQMTNHLKNEFPMADFYSKFGKTTSEKIE